MHLACIMGASFSFITINDKFTPRIVENVTTYGLEKRFVGAHKMNITRLHDPEGGFENPQSTARILSDSEAAAESGDKAGAEVLIAAGGVVSGLLAHWQVRQSECGIPILDGITSLVKMGEMAVKIQSLTGRFISKRRLYAPPPLEQIEELRKAYGNYIYPSVPGPGSR